MMYKYQFLCSFFVEPGGRRLCIIYIPIKDNTADFCAAFCRVWVQQSNLNMYETYFTHVLIFVRIREESDGNCLFNIYLLLVTLKIQSLYGVRVPKNLKKMVLSF